MNSKRGLMTVLIGLAMLATPIAASAKDHKYNDSHAAQHEYRNGAMWMPAPAVVSRHDWRDHHDWNANAYQNYGNRGYYGAPAYVAPVYPIMFAAGAVWIEAATQRRLWI